MRSDWERLRRSSIRVTRANVSQAKPQVNTFERLSKRSRSKVDLKMRRPMRHTRGMTDTAALARLAALELETPARLAAGLEEVYGLLPADMRLLVEYKFFEPGFYSTDLPDWGTAAMLCRRLGPQAQVLVDTGHHPQGTNVEQIVAVLLAEGLLGGFHFNNRKYADDDLIVGSIDPFELFRIMREIAAGGAKNVASMIDQSHNVEGKIDAMIQSVMNIQTAYAKALLVDEQRLAAAQRESDVLGAHRVLLEAFETDVRPLVARLRAEVGVEPDPVEAFRRGGYAERLAHERGTASVESAYERT